MDPIQLALKIRLGVVLICAAVDQPERVSHVCLARGSL